MDLMINDIGMAETIYAKKDAHAYTELVRHGLTSGTTSDDCNVCECFVKTCRYDKDNVPQMYGNH